MKKPILYGSIFLLFLMSYVVFPGKVDAYGTYLRIIELLVLISICGSYFFKLLILSDMKESEENYHYFFSKEVERNMYAVGFFIFLLTGVGQILSRLMQLTVVGSEAFWNAGWIMITAMNIGIVSWVQPLLLLVLYALTFHRKHKWFLKSFLFIALLYTFAWSSHAVHHHLLISHTIHLSVISIWFGGLIGFIMYSFQVPKKKNILKFIVQKLQLFSQIAICSIVFILLSGMILGVVYLESWNHLFESNYGLTLLWKMVIFSPILLIAVFHKYVWLPKLISMDTGEGEKPERNATIVRLFWGLRIELILAIIVMILAGFLSSTSLPEKENHQHNSHHGTGIMNIDVEKYELADSIEARRTKSYEINFLECERSKSLCNQRIFRLLS